VSSLRHGIGDAQPKRGGKVPPADIVDLLEQAFSAAG
jgi:hypothetical protein